MTTSTHQFSTAASVVEYHRDAFDVDRIHARGETAEYERVPAAWGGRGAEIAGLLGKEVTRDDFLAVLEGRICDQEIATGWLKTKDGSFIEHHKPGFDITFSMPKSFALMATLGGDERLLAVRDAAIAEALATFEAQGSRIRVSEHGVTHSVPADNLLYATFEHLTSRANDPHPHIHCVVANAVFVPDQPLQFSKEIYHDFGRPNYDPRPDAGGGLLPFSDADGPFREAAPVPVAGLRHLSDVGLVQQRNGVAVLLRPDASHFLGTQSQADHGVRREAAGTHANQGRGREEGSQGSREGAGRLADGVSGRWLPLDNSEFLRIRAAVTTTYLDSLAAGARQLGYTLEPGKKGMEIAGISRGQVEAFSARTGEIEQYLEARGATRENASHYAKQVANLRTRPDKELLPREQLLEHWRATAKEIGLDLQMLSTKPREVAQIRYVAPAEQQITAVVGSYIDRVNSARAAVAELNDRIADAMSRKDLAAFDALSAAAKIARAELRPASAQRIASSLHTKLPTLTAKDVERAMASAIAEGRMQRREGGGYSPESDQEARRRIQMEAAGGTNRKQLEATRAVEKVVANMHVRLAEVIAAQATLAAALESGDLRGAKAIADDLRETARGLAQTSGQIGYLARKDTPYITKAALDTAIRAQIRDGKLAERDGRLSVEPVDFATDRAKLISQTRPAQQLDAVSAAVSRVIERIEAARESLPMLRDELADAQKRGATTREKALTDEFRTASRLVDGLTDGQLSKMVRDELAPAHAAKSTGHKDLSDARNAKLAAYAGTSERQQSQGPAVSTDLIMQAVKNDGRLQDNLGRHSLESAAQTDARHQADKAFRGDLRAASRETSNAAFKANHAEKTAAFRAASKTRILADRAAYLKTLPPAQQKAIQNRQSSITRSAKFAVLAVRRPGTALRIATERIGSALIRDAGKTAGTMLHAVGALALTGAKVALDKRDTTREVQAKADMLRGKSQAARFGTLGYRQNGAGEIERAKILSLNNAVARVGTLALDITGFGRTTAGMAARNALVSSVSTTRVNAAEALLGRMVLAAHKAVAGRVSAAWTATKNKTRSVLAERRETKASAKIVSAYKTYRAAEHKYLAGQINARELRNEHDKLSTAVAATKKHTEKVYGRLEKDHQKGRISGKQLDRAYEVKKDRINGLDKLLGTYNSKHKALELRIEAQDRQAAIKELRANRPVGKRDEAYDAKLSKAQSNLRDTVSSLKKLEPSDLAQAKSKALGMELRQLRGVDDAIAKAAPKVEKTKEIRTVSAAKQQLNREPKMDNGNGKFDDLFGARGKANQQERDQAAGKNTADSLMRKERQADERQAEVTKRETNRDSAKAKDKGREQGYGW